MNFRNSILLLIFIFSPAANAASTAESLQVVAQLYRDFAWEAVIDEPEWAGHAFLDQPRDVLKRYFDSKLTALILQDRECVARTHEICKLDFLPIWASQDPGASQLKIVAGSAPDIINVNFRYPGNGTKIELSYRMVKTSTGWRIADIRYDQGFTLLSILTAKQ